MIFSTTKKNILAINSTITEKKIMIKDSMGDDFKNEMDQALRHLLFLQGFFPCFFYLNIFF